MKKLPTKIILLLLAMAVSSTAVAAGFSFGGFGFGDDEGGGRQSLGYQLMFEYFWSESGFIGDA